MIIMRIRSMRAREVLDSRGNPTVEVEVNGARAIVPSGVSAGTHEALELRDGGSRYMGRGVSVAVSNVNKIISKKITGKSFAQAELDGLMLKLDGTPDKSRLGANAILGVSMAFCAAQGETYETIGKLYGGRYVMPIPFINVLEGGKHAGNGLSVQEFMVVPSGAKKFSDALRIGSEIYHMLRDIIKEKYGKNSINVGDEGGFAPPLESTEDALELVSKSIEESGHGKETVIALDAAASEFFYDGSYMIDGKSLDADEMIDFYKSVVAGYHVRSIEDPFHEDDFESYAELLSSSRIQLVGDDLTVTNRERIQKAVEKKSCSCLLLKVNQVGTVSEALGAAKLVAKNKWRVMVSHRGGDTEDTFVSDLAVGMGCGMIKSGAPCRGERTAKYNRLLRIEERLPKARYGIRI